MGRTAAESGPPCREVAETSQLHAASRDDAGRAREPLKSGQPGRASWALWRGCDSVSQVPRQPRSCRKARDQCWRQSCVSESGVGKSPSISRRTASGNSGQTAISESSLTSPRTFGAAPCAALEQSAFRKSLGSLSLQDSESGLKILGWVNHRTGSIPVPATFSGSKAQRVLPRFDAFICLFAGMRRRRRGVHRSIFTTARKPSPLRWR